MKSYIVPTACSVLLSLLTHVRAAEYQIGEKGLDHRVWKKERIEQMPDGKTRTVVHSYTELETGMYYEENGELKESEAVIELTPQGASARKGRHKVDFLPNINSASAVAIEMPDGKSLKSRILGLSYYQPDTRQTVLIAELKDSIGEFHPPNQIIYPDAFTDIKADVRYTYTKAGLEQDVIFREQIPVPEDYTLNGAQLQLLTEWDNPPVPAKTKDARQGKAETDKVLDFGTMRIGVGKALLIGNNQPGNPRGSVTVDKEWVKLEGRDFLIEQLDFRSIKKHLDALPKRPQAGVKPKVDGVRHLVSNRRLLPGKNVAAGGRKSIKVAMVERSTIGFNLDYSIVHSTNDYIFHGDMTYLCTNVVNLTGLTVVEGGAVIKFSTNSLAKLSIDEIQCKTYDYRPAVFTSMHNDAVGEQISGSSGNPWTNHCGNVALYFTAGEDPQLRNLRFSHLNTAVDTSQNGSLLAENVQFVACEYPFLIDGNDVTVRNGLFYNIHTVFYGCGTVTLEHGTVHNCNSLEYDISNNGSTIHATNCLLVATTGLHDSYSTMTSNGVIRLTSDSGIFQTVGTAAHYLADSSPYRNIGTATINAGLLTALRKKTTYPPLVFSSSSITNETTFFPQAERDTDTLDIGYHYDPLDYIFGGVDVNENITFSAGTAVGWFRTSSGWYHAGHGIHVADQKIVTFDGRVDAPNYWVRCNTVAEGSVAEGFSYGRGGMTGWADQYEEDIGLSPEVHMRFTISSCLGSDAFQFCDDYGYITVRANESQFFGGGVGAYIVSCHLTNCLFVRSTVMQVAGWTSNAVYLRNCTMFGGNLLLSTYYSTIPIRIYDCAFDGTYISTNAYTGDAAYGYNAFSTNSVDRLIPTNSTYLTVDSFNWQTGPLGSYYLPNDSVLINAGSLTNAGLAGLYWHTMVTNEMREGNSPLDIGFHYLQTAAAGRGVRCMRLGRCRIS